MLEPSDVRRFERDLRAMSKKADDPDGFAQVVELAEQLHAELRRQARVLQREGYSASDLAAALGVSRQAAHKRWLA